MSDVHDLLRRLYTNGSEVTLDGDGIRLTGYPVPSDLLAELKAHKPELLAELKAHQLGTTDADFASARPRRYVVPASCTTQRACQRLGPCSRWLMRRSCSLEKPRKDGEAA